MNPHFTVSTVEKYTVIELRLPSLMDPIVLDEIAKELYRLVDEEDRRRIILDFEKVEYMPSMAIGILR